ncbi:TetR/AcrR family transcriptional regulator [Mesobacillus foraminis]|uniref:TetR/AcrR family transcriptional regulator n=1 Tax=Mesobacillus foraminis TaxID=279826 RepID=UPI001BE6114E|nr:TetR/AcrR family transcriptional regulator [Mesobacillus foraminis]MBT2755514.1 TetR/AcrR family transcriptional regulator [Mesobacillus foraminis]
MISKFLSLNQDKQERILNAAAQEFAQKGYANASTNEIVKAAGISKGLLFHYFNNKKDLYLFLYNHFVDVLMHEFFANLEDTEQDIFLKIKKIMLLKSQLMKKHPEIFNFMMSAYMEDSTEVKNDLDQRHSEMLQHSYSTIFSKIDPSLFKEGTDVKRAINIILWTLEGFSNQVLEKAKLTSEGTDGDFSAEFKEADLYIDMLRDAFYK